MAKKLIPTKSNLLKAKASLKLAKKGYDLLDKKRTVLIKELMDLNKGAKELQSQIEESFRNSYEALKEASITMGTQSIIQMSESIDYEPEYEIISRSVMGVELPKIKYDDEKSKVHYSIHRSTTAFDEASVDMLDVRYLLYRLAEVETSVFRLAVEVKKTQKRANALDKIQIPRYEKTSREIENILAEKEREDFFRLKKVKDKKN